jgi:hypothetical protein
MEVNMDGKDDVMKQAAIVMTRLANMAAGNRDECIHCGQKIVEFYQGARSVYARIEELEKCINPQNTSLEGKTWWCRQYQGKIPKADSE